LFEFRRVKWALRKSRLPVHENGLVLDVGSGGTPYPRSDVLLDRLTGAQHRCGDSMLVDRPSVFGDAQRMPFKDKAFDFVVASHILEHMSDPEIFLKELQRVAKAGYIETPNAIFERFRPYDIHSLEVMSVDNVLHIHKKNQPVEDSFLGNLGFLDRDRRWKKFFFERIDMFHVRLYWDTEIQYQIHNNEVSCDWIENINAESDTGEEKQSYLQSERGWRKYGLSILNRWYAYRRAKRLKNFDLHSILCCPSCHGELDSADKGLICYSCELEYSNEPLPDFTQGAPLRKNDTAA